MISLLTPAHLMGTGPHIEDILLYGGASLGLAFGVGLFLWGRVERRRDRDPSDETHPAGNAAGNIPARQSPLR
jgi:hypothetical protein